MSSENINTDNEKSKVFVKIQPVKVPLLRNELLKGRRAIVTGGSGGIGYGIAESFINNGASVILIGTNEKRLIEACEKLGEDKSRYVVMNLTDFSSYNEGFNKILKAFNDENHIDILVNAAGFMGKSNFLEITEKDWDSVLDINLKAMYFLSQKFAEFMIKNNYSGNILNVSSTSALKPGWNPYTISKAAVKSLTLGLSSELAEYNICVNAIAPGPVATKMLGKENDDNLWNKRYKGGRYATVEEVGNWATCLVSDMGKLVMGDSLYLSGGSGTLDICKSHKTLL